MTKTCQLLFFVCLSCVCFAQTKDTYYGVVLTRISKDGTSSDTSRLLYCRNTVGDHLTVYTVRDGVVSDATTYHLTETKNSLFLYSKPLLSDQLKKDSLRIEFQDNAHTVVINKVDHYTLFPAFYTRFKQEAKVKHSIIAVLNLLTDGIGDYPISDALPLLNYTPQLDQQIQNARIVTQRSQADMKDTWTCHYYYNKSNKLDSVSAISPDETRFSKKVRYHASKPVSVSTYLNIEDRQVTDKTIRYNNNRNTLKWQEQVDELGKNRETTLSVTLTSHDLGQLREIEPSTGEVLQLLKPKKTYDHSKKHID